MARMSSEDIVRVIGKIEEAMGSIDQFDEENCPEEVNDLYALLNRYKQELEDLAEDVVSYGSCLEIFA